MRDEWDELFAHPARWFLRRLALYAVAALTGGLAFILVAIIIALWKGGT
jgi:hypothetical protein